MSAAGSRSVMNAVLVFGRSESCGDLTLDPDGAELVDPVLDHHRDGADGIRIVRGLALLVSAHLAVARVILLASRVWNGARDLVDSS